MRLIVKMLFVMLMLIVVAAGCGGGGDDVSPSTTLSTPEMPTEPETPATPTPAEPEMLIEPETPATPTPAEPEMPQAGSNAPYTVSILNGSAGAAPVSVGSDTITVQGRTVQLESATQVGFQPGHHRAFDTPGATSGPALEIHLFGENEGYEHIRFGSWAKGVVSSNPGFRIGEQFGAFLAPNTGSGPTPTSNLPTTGSATWHGHYAGYVDREGVGVSQVVGQAVLVAFFGQTQFGDGGMLVELLPPDPDRSAFAVPPTGILGYDDRVMMNGNIKGNTFENDVTATYTVFGQTFPRGDTISTLGVGCSIGDCLYSQGLANSGGMQGGFFGNRGGEAGGTYHFTVGATKAAGSFGGELQ